jgi:DNA segregation ATPase FtsK/SpoIIIE-like protein
MILIDPKVVELKSYNGIPHLLQPVVTNPKKAYGVLNWAVMEMDRRYNLIAERNVREINAYNSLAEHFKDEDFEFLPHILIVIDELADLMYTTATEVEDAISRLMAKARAAGIHLIIATQRPSVDVITGVIKANIPSRIAFAVSAMVDSRTILDTGGAEKLLGKGDMLYSPVTASKMVRGQCALVTDNEVEDVLQFIKSHSDEDYVESVGAAIDKAAAGGDRMQRTAGEDGEDELLFEALTIFVEAGHATVSLLQRRLAVGHPRAARLVDRLEQLGLIGPSEGSKPRKVIVSKSEFEAMMAQRSEEESM